MKPRIFRASDMKTALEAVQRELGPDALVISARQISSPAWQIWQQPGQATEHVEILATLPGNASQPSAAKNTAHTAPRTGSPTPAAQPPASQQSRTPLPSSVSSPHAPSPVRPRPSALKLITQTLLNQGLDEKLAAKWMTACMQVYKSDSRESYQQLRTAVQFQMEAELKIISEKRITDGANQRYTGSDLYRPSQNVICLVGTSGVGKTSVAATLAARYARSGRKVAWICADTVRAGAIAQAQACADSLSIPLQFAYTPAELSALVSSGTDHRSGTDHHPSAILRQAQDASGRQARCFLQAR